MNRNIFIFLLLLICPVIFSQIPHIIPSSTSVANTSVADINSWTVFNNPAMLGYVQSVSLSVSYENRYILKELSTKSIQAGFATKYINIGAGFSYFGYSLYNEMLAGIDFSRNFSDKFSLGIGFDYYTAYFTAANKYHGALIGRVGGSVRLSSGFVLGFNTFNPFQNNIQTDFVTKRLPSVFSIGTSCFFIENFVWRTQIDKEISSNYRFATGFEYKMIDFLTIKLGGYFLENLIPCLGFGFHMWDYSFDLNCELNPVLGVTTMVTLNYNFNK